MTYFNGVSGYYGGVDGGSASLANIAALSEQAGESMANCWNEVYMAQRQFDDLIQSANAMAGVNGGGLPFSNSAGALGRNFGDMSAGGISSKVEDLIRKYPNMTQQEKDALRQAARSGQLTDAQLQGLDAALAQKYGASQAACVDGKDDGEITFGQKAQALLEGGIIEPIKSLASVKGVLTAGALTALCLAVPEVVPFLAVGGAVLGGVKLISGILGANNATTDKAAVDSYKSIGGGLTDTILSIAGLKGAKTHAETVSGKSLSLKDFWNYSKENFGSSFAKRVEGFKRASSEGGVWEGVKSLFGFKPKTAVEVRANTAAERQGFNLTEHIKNGGAQFNVPKPNITSAPGISGSQMHYAESLAALEEQARIKGCSSEVADILESCRTFARRAANGEITPSNANNFIGVEINKIQAKLGGNIQEAKFLSEYFKIPDGSGVVKNGSAYWFEQQRINAQKALSAYEEGVANLRGKIKSVCNGNDEFADSFIAQTEQAVAQGKKPQILEQINARQDYVKDLLSDRDAAKLLKELYGVDSSQSLQSPNGHTYKFKALLDAEKNVPDILGAEGRLARPDIQGALPDTNNYKIVNGACKGGGLTKKAFGSGKSAFGGKYGQYLDYTQINEQIKAYYPENVPKAQGSSPAVTEYNSVVNQYNKKRAAMTNWTDRSAMQNLAKAYRAVEEARAKLPSGEQSRLSSNAQQAVSNAEANVNKARKDVADANPIKSGWDYFNPKKWIERWNARPTINNAQEQLNSAQSALDAAKKGLNAEIEGGESAFTWKKAIVAAGVLNDATTYPEENRI